MSFTADIDVGGTFTDGFFTQGTEARTAKVLTTPYDLTECFLHCLQEGAGAFGVTLALFLRSMTVVRLSTTLGTNTLIQRRGPKVGLLVTKGHERDLYGQGEARALGLFVAPDMVEGIHEETDGQGHSAVAPERGEVLAAVRRLVELGARMIAVSLAGSWRNPMHERVIRELVLERYPAHYLRSIPLQLSHEISPVADDHARTNTVLLNAYVHPQLAGGLYRAEDIGREHGLSHPLLIVHASCRCARVAKTVAIQTLSSGPAVAVSGAARLAQTLNLERVITADMGGTSLDIAILEGSRQPIVEQPLVAGLRLAVPMIATESIGAGGGSIARLTDDGIEVGPDSAGSAPGPACYDKGGMEPTVTDANLVLGFLQADRFLGGRMKLNRKRAEDALHRRLGRQLGRPAEEIAVAIRARINARMAATLAERLSAQDASPSQFTLFAFGGGGPLHACGMAEQIGIGRVIGFPFGSVFSAFGSSTVDLHHRYWGSNLDVLRRQAVLDMRGEGFAEQDIEYDSGPAPGTSGLLLDARVAVPHWLPQPEETRDHRPDPTETRYILWETEHAPRPVETPIYQRSALTLGARIRGPALVEAPDTSYAVYPGWDATVDAFGDVVMERR